MCSSQCLVFKSYSLNNSIIYYYIVLAGMTLTADPLLRTLRVSVLSVVCDSPARCLVQDFIQFNGYFGCPTCTIQGKPVPTSVRGSTHAYPFDVSPGNATGHAPLRNHQETEEIARSVEQSGCTDRWVKGFSPLFALPGFDIIRGVTVDYMHCVLLGVMKKLVHLWTDTANKDEDWYIGNRTGELNARLRNISPPNVITRIPRDLEQIANWKASEYRSFLLFYSIPCLFGILPKEHFDHFQLLVESMHILLSYSIARSDLAKASRLIKRFCCAMDYTYHSKYESSNMHALLHLSGKVQDLGPLWAHSCFFFEDLNGDLRKLFHGTQNVQLQILHSVSVQQKLPELVTLLPLGSAEHSFYLKMTQKSLSHNRLAIVDNVYACGKIQRCTMPAGIQAMIERIYGKCEEFHKFLRIQVGKSVIHSKHYLAVTKRNSYTVKYVNNERNVCYGQVEYYVRCSFAHTDVFVAVVTGLDVQSDIVLSGDVETNVFTPVVATDRQSIVPVTDILELCVYLKFTGHGFDCVTVFPNRIEKD
jgi:hypothetical protein